MKRAEPAALATFVAIARHRSFRRAAAELGVTPSALSHALRTLETQLGVRLLNRTTRSVGLTEAGERLFARIEPAFRDIDQAVDELGASAGRVTGTLRLNAARSAMRLSLLPLVGRFLALHPQVRVELIGDEGLVDVVSGGFDAGVRFSETIAADMVTTPVGSPEAFAVVGSPGFFARHLAPRTPHELRGLPCVRMRFSSGAVFRWEFERDGEELVVEVDGPLLLNDIDLMVDAALTGAGLAYVFESAVRDRLASGELVRVLEDWCPRYPVFLYYPSRERQPPALRAFIDFVRSERE